MECMVSASFRSQDQAEILARIPQEQARIQTLREQGIVEALFFYIVGGSMFLPGWSAYH